MPIGAAEGQVRLATYNIHNGGADGDDRARLAQVIQVIQGVDPDVIAIEEANGFAANGGALLHQVERATGLRGHLCHTKSGFDVAVFVRPTLSVIRRGTASRSFHHGAAYADIELDGGAPLRVVGAHLAPDSGEQRLTEAKQLLRRVGVGAQVVVMGDFNSLDRSSGNLRSVAALPEQHRSRYLLPGTTDAIDTRAIDVIEAAGMLDLIDVAHPGVRQPTAPTRNGGGEEFHRMRLDRIFGTKALAAKVLGGGVRTVAPAGTASDHYLVWVDLDMVAAPRTRQSARPPLVVAVQRFGPLSVQRFGPLVRPRGPGVGW